MRQDFAPTYKKDFNRVNISTEWDEMASYIRALRKQNAIKIFSLPNRKIPLCVFSICAKWVKSCPISVYISITWKNLRSFLSIPERMQWAKKPSHRLNTVSWLAQQLVRSENLFLSFIFNLVWGNDPPKFPSEYQSWHPAPITVKVSWARRQPRPTLYSLQPQWCWPNLDL